MTSIQKFSFFMIAVIAGSLFAQQQQELHVQGEDPALILRRSEEERKRIVTSAEIYNQKQLEKIDAKEERNRKLRSLSPVQAYQFMQGEDQSDERLDEIILTHQTTDGLHREIEAEKNAKNEKPQSSNLVKIAIVVVALGLVSFFMLRGKRTGNETKVNNEKNNEKERGVFSLGE